MRTTVSIHGLQVYGYHGLFDEERRLGQKFLFDVRCQLVDVPTHQDDQLANSVGYDVLANEVSSISAAQKYKTVEALAETVARTLLARNGVIAALDIKVAKLSPPMAHALTSATVEVSLRRDETRGPGPQTP
jgi:dihydroneopterin aldolase